MVVQVLTVSTKYQEKQHNNNMGEREGGKRGNDKLLPNMKEKNIQNVCLRTIFLVNV